MWSFETDADFEQELAWMRQFVRDRVIPLEVAERDALGLPVGIADVQAEVKERGLWATHLDPELGGRGFGHVKLGLTHEIIGRSRVGPIAFGNQAPDSGKGEILARHGNVEQRAEYLEPLLAGDKRSAYAMTEPDAGTDPTLLRTRAELDGTDWVINGQKWFITNASIADFIIVMAVSDPDADTPHRRASQFIVDSQTEELEIVRELGTIEDPEPEFGKWDNHALVHLRDVRVPPSAMLGASRRGFAIAQERLGPGRIHHCMRWVGQASRALDMLCERSLYRLSHGSVLAEKQTIQNWVADSWTQVHAARLMTLHAAWKIDTQGVYAARTEISAIKAWGRRCCTR